MCPTSLPDELMRDIGMVPTPRGISYIISTKVRDSVSLKRVQDNKAVFISALVKTHRMINDHHHWCSGYQKNPSVSQYGRMFSHGYDEHEPFDPFLIKIPLTLFSEEE